MKTSLSYGQYFLMALFVIASGLPTRDSVQASGTGTRTSFTGPQPVAHLSRESLATDRIIVKFKATAGREARADVLSREKLQRLHGLGLIGA